VSFLNDPIETEEQRRAFLASAIHYARRASALADDFLRTPDGLDRKHMGPERQRYAPLIAAAAARACAEVAQTLELRVFHRGRAGLAMIMLCDRRHRGDSAGITLGRG
jgi:hypothetical protein